jgi:hypothetical protein
MKIPIYLNHEGLPIGTAEFVGDYVKAEFVEGVTREEFFQIFGNCAMQVVSEVNPATIKTAVIRHWVLTQVNRE